MMNMVLIQSAQKYDEHIDVNTPRADDGSVIRVTWHWTSSSWFKWLTVIPQMRLRSIMKLRL